METADPAGDDVGEVDFSGGVRGRFHRAGAELVPPVHLEPDVLQWLQKDAARRGVSLNDLVNEWLRREIEARTLAE